MTCYFCGPTYERGMFNKLLTIVFLLLTLAFSLWGAEPAASSQLAENLRNGKAQKVVVYGTSLCAAGAWVKQVQTLIDTGFPKLCTVINSAQSGKASNWGLDNIDGRVIALNPDTVLMEFSINDAYSIYKISVADAQKNLETMIKKMHTALPNCEIILMTMNQPIKGHAEARPAFPDYIAMYRKVAKDQNLKLIDMLPAWKKLFADDEEKWHLVVPDGIHPNADGGALITTPSIVKALFGAEKAR
jgi:acyl-CoA thioesterase I